MPHSSHPGFTLAELLISLAILAVIAIFTIPKIVSAQQNESMKLVLKEDVSIIQELIWSQVRDGNLQVRSAAACSSPPSGASLISWMQTHNNYTKLSGGTFYLANGSTINLHVGAMLDFLIDANGSAGPNTNGVDKLNYYFDYCSTGREFWYDTASQDLFYSLF